MSYKNTANSNGYSPTAVCCGSSGGSSGGSEAGAAALGMVGGMAVGAALDLAAAPKQPTTIIENVGAPVTAGPIPIATMIPMLPANASPTQIDGQYYYYYNSSYFKPIFDGSQVVYVASPVN
jgi:hypothetical protein